MDMRKKIILGAVFFVVLIGMTGYFIVSKKRAHEQNGQPQQSVEEILQERIKQAQARADTPLGKSFHSKNWVEFEKLYQPQKDFNQLAEIIRACFISNCFKDFKKNEMDRVFDYVVKTFSEMRSQDFALAGLLITQFERLPSPAHGSESYRTLESWFSNPDSSQAEKRMAILKLGIQDSNPDPKWVHAISQGLTGKTFGLTRMTWIQQVNDMRNGAARKKVLITLLKEFHKIEPEAQAEGLVVLAQNSSIAPKKIKTLFFRFLASDQLRDFEAALRSVLPQKNENQFDEKDILKIKDRLHSMPDHLKSPYVELKSKELLNTL